MIEIYLHVIVYIRPTVPLVTSTIDRRMGFSSKKNYRYIIEELEK